MLPTKAHFLGKHSLKYLNLVFYLVIIFENKTKSLRRMDKWVTMESYAFAKIRQKNIIVIKFLKKFHSHGRAYSHLKNRETENMRTRD